MNQQLPLNMLQGAPLAKPACLVDGEDQRSSTDDLPAPTAEPEKAFEWGIDESTVVPEQQAVAAYFNQSGSLVLRQERTWDRDEDSFVIIAEHNVQAFLDKLCNICGVPEVGRRG